MPFEPLKTDEKLERPVRSGPDWDTQMLMGCGGFIVASFVHFGLSVWPHFLFSAGYEMRNLAISAALGLIPASIFAAFAIRKTGIPAAGGILGGSFATAIFLHLRLRQFDAGRGLPDFPQPEFPTSWTWITPLAWVVVTLLIVLAALKPEEWNSLHEPGNLNDKP